MTGPLREFVEAVDRRVQKMFRRKGEVLPFYHIIDGQGADVILPMPPGDRDAAMIIVRAGFVVMDVRRYVLVIESWLKSPAADDANGEKLKAYMQNNSLADLPGSKEVVMYAAEDENEGALMAQREIIRKAGRPTLGPLEIHAFDGAEGRMIGMLPRKGTVQ